MSNPTGPATVHGIPNFAADDRPLLAGSPGLPDILAVVDSKIGVYTIWDSVDAGVSLPAASITTPTLPQTFRHLRVLMLLRDTGVSAQVRGGLRFNGDAGNSYYWGENSVNNSAPANTNSGPTAVASISLGYPGTGGDGATFGVHDLLIADYARAGNFKSCVSAFGAHSSAASWFVGVTSGLWTNNAASITTLTFVTGQTAFAAGCRFTVQGVM